MVRMAHPTDYSTACCVAQFGQQGISRCMTATAVIKNSTVGISTDNKFPHSEADWQRFVTGNNPALGIQAEKKVNTPG
jgi:hypothetical protein